MNCDCMRPAILAILVHYMYKFFNACRPMHSLSDVGLQLQVYMVVYVCMNTTLHVSIHDNNQKWSIL